MPTLTDPLARLLPRRNELGAPLGNVNELGDALPAQVLPPYAVAPPTARDMTMQRISGDQSQLNKLRTDGPGVNRIGNPVVRALGKIGDVALSAVAPRLASFTPGTTLNNNRLQDQQQGRLTADLGADKDQAGTELLNAQPALKQAALENQTLKTQGNIQHQQDMLDATQEKNKQTYLTNLMRGGHTLDESDPTGQKTRPLRYEEMSDQQQAVTDLNHAREQQAEATAELKKAQNDPSSPQFRLAQQKADAATRNANTAVARLSRQDESLSMRREQMDANLYGTGKNGQVLANAPQFVGDNGEITVGGLRGAATAIKQQGATGQYKDLGGSLKRTQGLLDALHNSGADLSDVRVIDALQGAETNHGVLNTALRSRFIKSGLTEQQVNAVAGVAALREQLGTLRAAAKGSNAEAQTQRMLDAAPTAGDTKELANRKMVELNATYDRLAPSVVTIAGGLSLNGKGGHQAGDIPAAAASQLQEGIEHTFGNGQVWTKRAGKPVRVR